MSKARPKLSTQAGGFGWLPPELDSVPLSASNGLACSLLLGSEL